ncbi:MAG: hypothetical protein KDD35_04935 [Bdellovibrionales bacterium]|nr:hypothetical protein [Bdellovibrionales bacterium]
MKKIQSLQIVILGIILSLLIHGGLFLGISLLPPPTSHNFGGKIDVIYKEPIHRDSSGTFVRDPDLGIIEKEINKQARYLSRFNRRVKEEKLAHSRPHPIRTPHKANSPQVNNGEIDFRPRLDQKSKPLSQSDRSVKGNLQAGMPAVDSQGDLSFIPGYKPVTDTSDREVKTSSSESLKFGGSISEEFIPHLKRGEFTSLNTNQFTYYTFFYLNEQVRMRWFQEMSLFSSSLNLVDSRRIAMSSRLTILEVILEQDGYLKDIVIRKTSGEESLDQTAVSAFAKAAPFLNPPLGMVSENDDLIHLTFSFYVEWQPRYFARDAN